MCGEKISGSFSWPSAEFRQSQDRWMLTCICMTSCGVPEGLGWWRGWPEDPTWLEDFSCPRWPYGLAGDQDESAHENKP